MNSLASIALRLIPGAFILNSGLGKIGAPKEASEGMQQAAATGIPAVNNIPSEKFGDVLGYSETALGAALLLPVVPNWLAGAGLATFGTGLLTMYFGNDENTLDDGIRPSQSGTSLAKDSWLVAIGVALLAGGLAARKKKDSDK